jgi:protein phosphatase
MYLNTFLEKVLKRLKPQIKAMTIIDGYSISIALASDIGSYRVNNEDAVWCYSPEENPRIALAIVADGMGGHKAGEVASKEAVDVIANYCLENNFLNPQKSLMEAFRLANQSINRLSHDHYECRGMGTTATVLMIVDGMGCYGHVGDTRLYQIRDRRIVQMTQDHTLVAQMLEYGMISKDEARVHPKKNILTNALGTSAEILVDVSDQLFPIQIGDLYLLCSDGLVDKIGDDEILQLVMHNTAEQACALLVDAAIANGGNDNISVIILTIQSCH